MQAGFATSDITPGESVWMDGMIRAHRSEGVEDALYARAVVLADRADMPATAYAIVAADVCTLDAEACACARRMAAQLTGIPFDQIVVAATHTHSGPATHGFFNPKERTYVLRLIEQLALAVQRAWETRRPAAAGWASGRETTISHYRRLLADDGHVVMNWEPFPPERIVRALGETDPEVGVLKLTPPDSPDTPMGLVFEHAGHPNVLSGDNYRISPDYPGLAVRRIEAALGGPALFVNGAQGTMDIDGLKDRDRCGLERCAAALAEAVLATARDAPARADARVRGGVARYTVPARKITRAELAWARAIRKSTGGAVRPVADGVGDDYKANLYLKLHAVERRPLPVEQVCVAVGECAFLSFPCELFTEIGVRIKAASPFRHTWPIGLANGYIGYVPTREAIAQGGYEPDTRCVAGDAEEILVARSLKLLHEVARRCD